MKRHIQNIWFSFPIQLLVAHVKYHLLLTAIWVLLGSFITDTTATMYGAKYLFWTPEYLGEVNFWSFFFLGVGLAGLIMTWNMTTYLISAHRFPFLASLSRPFTKFCINNFIIPFFFIGMIVFYYVRFEVIEGETDFVEVLSNVAGFLSGLVILVLALITYFAFTNKDILAFAEYRDEFSPPNRIRTLGPGRGIPLEDIRAAKKGRKVWYYLTESLAPRRVRSVAHYSLKSLQRVFKQNHSNALAVQLLSLFILVGLGLMIDRPAFRIPAGASTMLFACVIVTIIGAIIYWFNRWSFPVFIAIFMGFNFMTKQGWLNHENKAYGLDYTTANQPTYNYAEMEAAFSDSIQNIDIQNTLNTLNNWKQRTGEAKPKMVMIGVSGGGLKAATWAMQVLRMSDSLTQSELMAHTALMSGASGGMMGMAYFRELYLRQQEGEAVGLYDKVHVADVSKDLLNSISFTILTNDLFIPKGEFLVKDEKFTKDRGYIFESQFSENTHGRLEKVLGDYRLPEQQGRIPTMVITPYILNDARRLIISAQPMSYLTAPASADNDVDIDAIDFQRFFHRQQPDSLRFLTALRMNATYPYILPSVTLPTSPDIEVMDAGFRDNFGTETAARFVRVFQDWIKKNTSGVILLNIRVIPRESRKIEETDQDGILKSLLDPLGIAGKLIQLQDYEHDMYISFMEALLGEEQLSVIPFIYEPSKLNEEASMSFHLTPKEKNDIMEAFYLPQNQVSMQQLKLLIDK